MTGAVVDSARAERIGLVSEVVAHDRLLERAVEVAQQIAEVPGATMQALKQIYTTGAAAIIDPALAAEQAIAGAQVIETQGLSARYRAVSDRNREQIGDAGRIPGGSNQFEP